MSIGEILGNILVILIEIFGSVKIKRRKINVLSLFIPFIFSYSLFLWLLSFIFKELLGYLFLAVVMLLSTIIMSLFFDSLLLYLIKKKDIREFKKDSEKINNELLYLKVLYLKSLKNSKVRNTKKILEKLNKTKKDIDLMDRNLQFLMFGEFFSIFISIFFSIRWIYVFRFIKNINIFFFLLSSPIFIFVYISLIFLPLQILSKFRNPYEITEIKTKSGKRFVGDIKEETKNYIILETVEPHKNKNSILTEISIPKEEVEFYKTYYFFDLIKQEKKKEKKSSI